MFDFSVFVSVLTVLWIVFEYIVKIIAVGVVPENRRPGSSSAWLLLILFLPIVGIPLFLLLGSPYVNRRRQEIQAEANELLEHGTAGIPDVPEDARIDPDLAPIIRLNRELTSLPMVHGVNHGVSADYEESIRRMARMIDTAEEYVLVEFYILAWDDTTDVFFQAMLRAAERGVRVKVLFDHLGSRKYPGFKSLGARLTAAGIEWNLMLPLKLKRGSINRVDLRNHRKLLVVDGHTGAMGSQNLIDSSYLMDKNIESGRHWNDVMIFLEGPIISALTSVFAVDWFAETGHDIGIRPYEEAEAALPVAASGQVEAAQINSVQLVPSGPGFRTEPNLKLFTSLMYQAKESLSIVSPYFVPDETLFDAVRTAAFRGVRVELFVSEEADQYMVDRAQSSYYQLLLDAGVHIYLYPKPAVLHTKCFTIDGRVSVIGSSNMDMRSFGLNFEISLMATDGDITGQIDGVIDAYRAKSTLLTQEDWGKRPWTRRYMESVMRLTSALQ